MQFSFLFKSNKLKCFRFCLQRIYILAVLAEIDNEGAVTVEADHTEIDEMNARIGCFMTVGKLLSLVIGIIGVCGKISGIGLADADKRN